MFYLTFIHLKGIKDGIPEQNSKYSFNASFIDNFIFSSIYFVSTDYITLTVHFCITIFSLSRLHNFRSI